MIVAVTCATGDESAQVDPRFGRAAGFFVKDLDSGETSFVDNAQNLSLPQGAGIQSAQNVAATGAKAVLTGHVGPKAFMALEKGGIAIHIGVGGTVAQALEDFQAGKLPAAAGPDKDGHW